MRGAKLAVAPVPGAAGPWVRWAILIEGRERTGLQLPPVHKPLYRSHVMFDCHRGTVMGGGVAH